VFFPAGLGFIFVVAYMYLTMVGTSVHVIAKLFDLRRNKVITTKQIVVHSILQFIFVADVIECIYLALKQKKIEKALE
jgi:quinol-cytochrome oxidoreductase complex cytochrome b subunit